MLKDRLGVWIVLFALGAAAAAQEPGPEDFPLYPEPFREPTEAQTPLLATAEAAAEDRTVAVNLSLGYTETTLGNQKVRLRTYNGSLLGPTIRVRPGDTLKVQLNNELPCPRGRDCSCKPCRDEPGAHAHHAAGPPAASVFNTTNLHTHGLHVTPRCPGDNVLLEIEPGCSYSYTFEIPKDHPVGTFWYHPHVHGSTAIQVGSGAAGALIVEGGEGSFDGVLRIPPEKEKIFLFQQIPYRCKANPNDFSCAPGDVGTVETFDVFGPNTWTQSKRYTTINGLVQPVIDMRPGEVQRWRMIHGGVRETLMLGIIPSQADVEFLEPAFYEVALDGIPTGDLEKKKSIELQPGYRSDALVHAGWREGTYYLIDQETPPEVSLLQESEPRKVLAVIRVTGEPCRPGDRTCTVRLPSARELARFRPESLYAPDGFQEAEFNIDVNQSPAAFQINGKSFDPHQPRVLKLGRMDEWTLTSQRASHPFHIHVNPFEVLEKRPDGTTKRSWKDTLLVRQGQTLKIRTKYETFDGSFVLHCHILDHEDQGMMELVRIVK